MEHKAKILLADDSAAIRALISEILTDAGFDVSPPKTDRTRWTNL